MNTNGHELEAMGWTQTCRRADFQSAVSPISNLQATQSIAGCGLVHGSQAGTAAMQQLGNLRCLRVALRVLWLASQVVVALVGFAGLIVRQGGTPGMAARTRWLQGVCRRALGLFRMNLVVSGPIPSSGLLVCNHLSYLDILVLGATMPCVFVSKCEVRGWPVFGWFASLAGTLFLRRENRSDLARMTREMRRILDEGALVVLFPEGTSSDGSKVLPFKSSLLEPVARQPYALSAGFIEYGLSDGDVAEEVCYWKDMTLLPHLLNLFGKGSLAARLRFSELREGRGDRKQLAQQLHSEVVRLKNPCKVSVNGATHP